MWFEQSATRRTDGPGAASPRSGAAARYSRAEAAVLGSGLNARGAVEIAVAAVGLELGVLGRGMYTVVVGVAVLTSAMTPPLLRATLRRLPRPSDAAA